MFLVICNAVCNILQLINVSGFAEMHVEKQNIYNKLATWHYKAEAYVSSSLRNTFSRQPRNNHDTRFHIFSIQVPTPYS